MDQPLVDIEISLAKKHSNNVREFMTAQFKNIKFRAIRDNFVADVFVIKTDTYCDSVAQAAKEVKNVFLYDRELEAFYKTIMNSPKIESGSITIPMYRKSDSLVPIKSGVIQEYINNVEFTLDHLLNKRMKSSQVKEPDNKRFSDATEALFAGTDINISTVIGDTDFKKTKDLTDLLKSQVPSVNVVVTPGYINNTILPFIKNYRKDRSRLMDEGSVIITDIKNGTYRINQMREVLNKMEAENANRDFLLKLNKYFIDAERHFLELAAYSAFLYVRKVGNYIHDCSVCTEFMTEFKNKYNTMSDVYQEMGDTSLIFPLDATAVATDFLSNGFSALLNYRNNILDYHMFLITGTSRDKIDNPLEIEEKLDEGLENYTYDKYPYDCMNQMYGEISQGLDVIAEVFDEYLMSADDLITEAGFGTPIKVKYEKTLKAISNIGLYESDIELMDGNTDARESAFRILKELNEFDDNIKTSSSIASMVYEKINEVISMMDSNINEKYKNIAMTKEIGKFLTDFLDQYREITESVMRALIKRLNLLSKLLEKYEVSIDNRAEELMESPMIDMDDDFNLYEVLIESMIEDAEEDTKEIFSKLLTEYYVERESAERGLQIILEADENQNQNQQQNQTNNTQNNNTKSTTGVSVNDGDYSGKSGSGSSDSILTKLKERVSGVIDKLMEKFQTVISNQSKHNVKWLTDNRNILETRRYTNVSASILPYDQMPVNTIKSDITQLSTNLKKINNTTIGGLDSAEKVRGTLFSFIENNAEVTKAGTTEEMVKYFRQHYSTGSKPYEVVEYKNGELKTKVSEMLTYCNDYYNGIENDITNSMKGIKDSINAVCDQNLKGTTDENLNDKATWIKEALSSFETGVIYALRDRNRDYLKLLNNLLPKGAAVEANNNATQTAPQQEAPDNNATPETNNQ